MSYVCGGEGEGEALLKAEWVSYVCGGKGEGALLKILRGGMW